MLRLDRRMALVGLGGFAAALPLARARAAGPVIRLLTGQRVEVLGSDREESAAGSEGVLRFAADNPPGEPAGRAELLDLVFEQVFGPLLEPAALSRARLELVEGGGTPERARYELAGAQEWHRAAPKVPAVQPSGFAPIGQGDRTVLASGSEITLEWISRGHIDRFGGPGYLLGLRTDLDIEDRAALVPVMVETWDLFLRQRIVEERAKGSLVLAFSEVQRSRFHFRPNVVMEVRYTGGEAQVDFADPRQAPLFEAIRAVEAGAGLSGAVGAAHRPAPQ